jgi:anti-sigma28 factor (negative regulator of flagellin synthesis)
MRLQLDTVLTGTGITGAGETGQTVPAAGTGSGSGRIGGDSAGGDSIQISGPSSALNLLSTDRAARIQQLTDQVGSGSYNVSSPRVSQAIVGYAFSPAGSGA